MIRVILDVIFIQLYTLIIKRYKNDQHPIGIVSGIISVIVVLNLSSFLVYMEMIQEIKAIKNFNDFVLSENNGVIFFILSNIILSSYIMFLYWDKRKISRKTEEVLKKNVAFNKVVLIVFLTSPTFWILLF